MHDPRRTSDLQLAMIKSSRALAKHKQLNRDEFANVISIIALFSRAAKVISGWLLLTTSQSHF